MMQYLTNHTNWSISLDPFNMFHDETEKISYYDDDLNIVEVSEINLAERGTLTLDEIYQEWPDSISQYQVKVKNVGGFQIVYQTTKAQYLTNIIYKPQTNTCVVSGKKNFYAFTKEQLRYAVYNNLFEWPLKTVISYYNSPNNAYGDQFYVLTTPVICNLIDSTNSEIVFPKFSEIFLLLPQAYRNRYLGNSTDAMYSSKWNRLGDQMNWFIRPNQLSTRCNQDSFKEYIRTIIFDADNAYVRLQNVCRIFELPIYTGIACAQDAYSEYDEDELTKRMWSFLLHLKYQKFSGISFLLYQHVFENALLDVDRIESIDSPKTVSDIILQKMLGLSEDSTSSKYLDSDFDEIFKDLWNTQYLNDCMSQFVIPYHIRVNYKEILPQPKLDSIKITISQSTDTAVNYSIGFSASKAYDIHTLSHDLNNPNDMLLFAQSAYDDDIPHNRSNFVSLVSSYPFEFDPLNFMIEKNYAYGLRELLQRNSTPYLKTFLEKQTKIDPKLYVIAVDIYNSRNQIPDASAFDMPQTNYAFENDTDVIHDISPEVLSSCVAMLANEDTNSVSRPIGTCLEYHIFGNEIPHEVSLAFQNVMKHNDNDNLFSGIETKDVLNINEIRTRLNEKYPAALRDIVVRTRISGGYNLNGDYTYFPSAWHRLGLLDPPTDVFKNNPYSLPSNESPYQTYERLSEKYNYSSPPEYTRPLSEFNPSARTMDYESKFEFLGNPSPKSFGANLRGINKTKLTLTKLRMCKFLEPSSYSYFGYIKSGMSNAREGCHYQMIAASGVVNTNISFEDYSTSNEIVNFLGREIIPIWTASPERRNPFNIYDTDSCKYANSDINGAFCLNNGLTKLKYGVHRTPFQDFPVLNEKNKIMVYAENEALQYTHTEIEHIYDKLNEVSLEISSTGIDVIRNQNRMFLSMDFRFNLPTLPIYASRTVDNINMSKVMPLNYHNMRMDLLSVYLRPSTCELSRYQNTSTNLYPMHIIHKCQTGYFDFSEKEIFATYANGIDIGCRSLGLYADDQSHSGNTCHTGSITMKNVPQKFGSVGKDSVYVVGKYSYPTKVYEQDDSVRIIEFPPDTYVAINGITDSLRPQIIEPILKKLTTITTYLNGLADVSFYKYVVVDSNTEMCFDYIMSELDENVLADSENLVNVIEFEPVDRVSYRKKAISFSNGYHADNIEDSEINLKILNCVTRTYSSESPKIEMPNSFVLGLGENIGYYSEIGFTSKDLRKKGPLTWPYSVI